MFSCFVYKHNSLIHVGIAAIVNKYAIADSGTQSKVCAFPNVVMYALESVRIFTGYSSKRV